MLYNLILCLFGLSNTNLYKQHLEKQLVILQTPVDPSAILPDLQNIKNRSPIQKLVKHN